MLPTLITDWLKEHDWIFSASDPGLDGYQFVWIKDKRMFAVGPDHVLIPHSYYDRATGFVPNEGGAQVWYAGDPELFPKLERYINDTR